jgi:alkylation response protein AidB-like acyl-CoA dehydrogenase
VDLPADPRLQAAAELARDVLAPAAERVDVEGLPPSHVSALADAGLLGLHADPPPAAVLREITETVAAACGTTWFVWTQHKTPVRALLATPNTELRDTWLPRLTTHSLGAVAFSHLRRRSGQLTAREVDGGWRLDGTVSWLTGWGLAAVVLVSADAGEAGYVHLLVDATEQPGLTMRPLSLAAMNGTHTVAVRFDNVVVGADRLVGVSAPEQWHRDDDVATADVSPAVFGVARGALASLDVEEPALADELDGLRETAYAAANSDAPLAERIALRGQALALCVRITAAAVTAAGGRALALDHPAQRRMREAMFLLIQAQTAPVRATTLHALSTTPALSRRADLPNDGGPAPAEAEQ